MPGADRPGGWSSWRHWPQPSSRNKPSSRPVTPRRKHDYFFVSAWIGRNLILRKETEPWSPWSAMYPTSDFAKFGIAPNLLLATRALKSSLCNLYSKYFTPLISCSHFSGVISRRTWFHSPTGLVASSIFPVLGSIGG